jgi:hypothetical protein
MALEIPPGMVPLRTSGINQFAHYSLDFRRNIGPMNFEAILNLLVSQRALMRFFLMNPCRPSLLPNVFSQARGVA